MDREVARHVGLNGLKELAKLTGSMPSMRLSDDGAGLRLQCRKQRGGAMTPGVMAAPLSLPRVQGQQRLAAIQRLDLRLLIDAQDKGFVWRTQIEPDNVSDFLNEQRIGRQLERLRAMRLNPKARQIRQTALWLRPVAVAIARLLQCVASSGRVSKVRVTTCSTCASVIRRGAPGRGSSSKPSSRCCRKRCRHLLTICGVTRCCCATTWFSCPAAQPRISRARWARACAVVRRRADQKMVSHLEGL